MFSGFVGRDVLLRKNAFFKILSKWGGGIPAQIFWHRSAFLVNKGAFFFQNGNNLNLKYIQGV